MILTSAALVAAGNRFARVLDAVDVPLRGSVAVLAGNIPEYLAAYRGTTWSGRQFTPMSWRWAADDVAYVIENCEADVLVVESRFAHLVGDAASLVGDECRFVIGDTVSGYRPWTDVESMSGDALDDPIAGTTMLYTSGTTGRPKGVRRDPPPGPPPGVMGRGGMDMLRWCLGGDADRAHLVCTPLYHSGPLTYADGASLLGAELVLLDRFEPELVLRTIEEHQVTSTFMVPTQFVRLLRLPDEVRAAHDLSSLKLVVHASAPVAPEVKRAMIDWLGPVLFEFYGGTEGGGVSITSEDWLAHPGSVGKPREGLAMEIRDDAGTAVMTGVEGQIWFHDGRGAFQYKDDAEKTAEAVRDGWFTLGDIGYVDGDGYLFLCDRRADVIISGGVNVYPAQIEAALLGHPTVGDCCVVGVPDDEWGETIRAVVQTADGFEAGDALATELIDHCRATLAAYQVPRAIDFDSELPRTETGKLARRTIRDRYWSGRSRRI